MQQFREVDIYFQNRIYMHWTKTKLAMLSLTTSSYLRFFAAVNVQISVHPLSRGRFIYIFFVALHAGILCVWVKAIVATAFVLNTISY